VALLLAMSFDTHKNTPKIAGLEKTLWGCLGRRFQDSRDIPLHALNVKNERGAIRRCRRRPALELAVEWKISLSHVQTDPARVRTCKPDVMRRYSRAITVNTQGYSCLSKSTLLE